MPSQMISINVLLSTCLLLLTPAQELRRQQGRSAVIINTWRIGQQHKTPTPAPGPAPGPAAECKCGGSKKSGDGIGPCICSQNGGTCKCRPKAQPAGPAPIKPIVPQLLEHPGPPLYVDITPEPAKPEPPRVETPKPEPEPPKVAPKPADVDQVLVITAPACAYCLKVKKDSYTELRKAGWRVDTQTGSHFRTVDIMADWPPELAPLLAELQVTSVPQAVFLRNGQPIRENNKIVRRILPGSPMTGGDLTNLYYGHAPTAVVAAPQPPVRHWTFPKDQTISQHLQENHGHELPAGTDLGKLSAEEQLILHDRLHTAEAAQRAPTPVRHKGKHRR